MDEQSGLRRAVGLGLGLTIIGAALAAAALASGCSGDISDAEGAVRTVPSEDVLCQIYEEYEINGGVGSTYFPGSLGSDVIAALGEPASRDGNAWTYEWCVGAECARKAGLRVSLAEQSLCVARKPIGGLWVTDLEPVGMARPKCWSPDLRNGAPTCAGCLNAGEAKRCPAFLAQ